MAVFAWTFEAGQIEVALLGNAHGMGVDVTLNLNEDLQPDQPSSIDLVLSNFDIENSISPKGHVISGMVVPVGDPPVGKYSAWPTRSDSGGLTLYRRLYRDWLGGA